VLEVSHFAEGPLILTTKSMSCCRVSPSSTKLKRWSTLL